MENMQQFKYNRRQSGGKSVKASKMVPAVLAVMMGASGGSFALAAETAPTAAAPAAAASATVPAGFSDVKSGYWAEKHIYKLAAQGIVLGQNGQFKPGDNITRQEAITMAIRFIGAESELGSAETAVLPNGLTVSNYFKPYVDLALDKGLIKSAEESDAEGKSWGTQPASREWVTKILVRAIGKESEALASSAATSFADNASIAKGSVGYVSTAVKLGIAQGVENNKFNPAGSVTRAQMATFLSRAESYITPTYAGMTTGIVTGLTPNSLTLYADGKSTTYALGSGTVYFAADSEAKVQPSAVQLYTRVMAAGTGQQAAYVEIVDAKPQVETITGEFDRVTGSNTLWMKAENDYPKYEYDASTVFLDQNGNKVDPKSVSAGSRVTLLRETYSGQNKILTVQVTSGNVSKTDTGTVASVDTAAGTVTLTASAGLSEQYKLDSSSIVRYQNEILNAADLKPGSKIRYTVENNVIRTIEVTESVERTITASLYQTSVDGSTLTYQTDSGALEVKLIADKAAVVIGDKAALFQDLIADKKQGDRVTLTLNGNGEVTRIVVKDREATQLSFATVSSYDPATGVLAVIDSAGKPHAFSLDANTKLTYNNASLSPSLKGIEPLLVKGRGVNLTAVSSRLLSLEVVYKYEGTVEQVNAAALSLTLKLDDGTSVKLPYGTTGTVVQAYGVSNATMSNVKTGDRVVASLYADRVALQSVAVQTTKQFRVTGTTPGSSRLSVEQGGVTSNLYVDNKLILNAQGGQIGYAGLTVGSLVDVTFSGPDVSKVRLSDSVIGTVQSVDAASRSVTLLTSTGATRTYSGAVTPLNVNQNGSIVSGVATLTAGQHVQAVVQPDGSTLFTAFQALSKSFWRYDAVTQTVYVKVTPGSSEANSFKLAPEAWVHQGATNISVQSLAGDDKIVLYLNNNVVYELAKQ
ncbi:S-layer homology domain-containing protein [Saccharibacillus alkalitolerans]|uniref:S-layer homology domain-containing protein n=1 Tax=Saccharibacillus alkalitolerans TaxID=2705290 RepID=A0ABX0EZX2_9BACL|nr:S-layer homology domain-containing protein [Saccharibacillus alkalitolerans]NGZ74301.1 S-layer homology domain-containing protein [Saccharibacillus alkalitolerans]